jgi:hypothetical protein
MILLSRKKYVLILKFSEVKKIFFLKKTLGPWPCHGTETRSGVSIKKSAQYVPPSSFFFFFVLSLSSSSRPESDRGVPTRFEGEEIKTQDLKVN